MLTLPTSSDTQCVQLPIKQATQSSFLHFSVLPDPHCCFHYFSLEIALMSGLDVTLDEHNISEMETTPKSYHLSDDSKSLPSHDHLRQAGGQAQILELNEQPQSQGLERDIQVKYYLEFKKIYFTSFKLWSEILKQSKIKDSLASRIAQMEVAQRLIQNQLATLHKSRRHEDVEEEIEEQELSSRRKNSKRTRRTAEEIERKYYCVADFCGRCYGSEGSLQQHIKLKHPELYKQSEDEQDY